jgi:hypothetical protein
MKNEDCMDCTKSSQTYMSFDQKIKIEDKSKEDTPIYIELATYMVHRSAVT